MKRRGDIRVYLDGSGKFRVLECLLTTEGAARSVSLKRPGDVMRFLRLCGLDKMPILPGSRGDSIVVAVPWLRDEAFELFRV